ncbi:MAG: hypothetical protein JJU42_06575 [Rhodobacteraceae bacterium]|nr:hypothetical protein [Paracoccaceae bacterium]
MATVTDVIDRTARVLPRIRHADWLLRVPLALVLFQYGFDKFPLDADVAAGWGLPLFLWALAGFAEIGVAAMLLAGGLLRGRPGELVTRLAGAGAAVIVAGVVVVAYRAPPLDLLMFNQFHILLLGAGAYLALKPHPQ